MSEYKLPESVSLLTRESVKHKVELHNLIANGGANSIESLENYLHLKLTELRDRYEQDKDSFSEEYLNGIKSQIDNVERAIHEIRQYENYITNEHCLNLTKLNRIDEFKALLANEHAWTRSGYLLKEFEV
jgi:hypothetical protein